MTRLSTLIGLGIVAAGWSIMFLQVSTDHFGHEACGTSCHAMFSPSNNLDYECGEAAFPHLWIAGAVFAVGMGIAFWDGRVHRIRRLLAMIGLAVLLTLLINAAGLIAAGGMGGE